MPVLLQGSCHCKAIKYTLESNTPVPYQLCQCSICRKVGGYMGSVNIMGNTSTLKIIKGEGKMKVYIAPMSFDEDDNVLEKGICKRTFCSECSTMLWNYHDEYPEWIYPFASSIDKPSPLPKIPESASLITIMRDSCPNDVPIPKNSEVYGEYGPGAGIEEWHKKNGVWVD